MRNHMRKWPLLVAHIGVMLRIETGSVELVRSQVEKRLNPRICASRRIIKLICSKPNGNGMIPQGLPRYERANTGEWLNIVLVSGMKGLLCSCTESCLPAQCPLRPM
jgi:hypothetical protein